MRTPFILSCLIVSGALALGCVERTPGLTIVVMVDAQPTTSLPMPEGALAIDSALLFVDQVELLACDETVATPTPSVFDWLIGSAWAHGDGGGGGLSTPVAPIDALDDDPFTIARFAVPPGVAWCGLQFASGEGSGIALAGRIDDTPHSWLAPFENAPRLPFAATTLDADNRIATVTVRFALEDWAVDLPPDGEAGPRLAANAAAALTARSDVP